VRMLEFNFNRSQVSYSMPLQVPTTSLLRLFFSSQLIHPFLCLFFSRSTLPALQGATKRSTIDSGLRTPFSELLFAVHNSNTFLIDQSPAATLAISLSFSVPSEWMPARRTGPAPSDQRPARSPLPTSVSVLASPLRHRPGTPTFRMYITLRLSEEVRQTATLARRRKTKRSPRRHGREPKRHPKTKCVLSPFLAADLEGGGG
jgi:hypothetical protein